MSDTDLARLSAAARRGTSRTGLPEPTPTPLGEALRQVQRDAPEATLLARAALSGLYLRAGRTSSLPTVPAPQFAQTGPPAPGIPAVLDRLLLPLAEHPEVLREALGLLYPSGRRLNAVQARPLLTLNDQGGDPLHGSLWPVLNEHARWLARLHPVWKRQDPETLPASVALAWLRRELVEAHTADPQHSAADLMARWATFRADERRVALNAAASSLHPADWPLLTLAMNDKLPDLRRQARLLQGHLPGEVQDAVRAALPSWFKQERGTLRLVRGHYVDALGQPDADDHRDGELGRMLGALPATKLPLVSGVDLQTLLNALKTDMGQQGNSQPWRVQGTEQQVLADLERASVSELALEQRELLWMSVQPESLPFWPQARVRALLWEATGRLLEQAELNGPRLRLTLQLLGALEGALPLVADDGPASKRGLLARVVSVLGVGRAEQPDWPARLPDLAERLLSALSREVSSHPLPLEALLSALLVHLDPARPDPRSPKPVPPPELPEGADKQQQEAQTVALILYRQQLRAQTGMAHTLALRRQVRAALAGEA